MRKKDAQPQTGRLGYVFLCTCLRELSQKYGGTPLL